MRAACQSIDAQHLSANVISAVTPGIDARTVTPQGAIFNPGECWVDLLLLIEVLVAEFIGCGGQLVTDAGQAKVTITHGRATGITTASGRSFNADAVLLATCGDVPRMAAEAGLHIADVTPIALLVRTGRLQGAEEEC